MNRNLANPSHGGFCSSGSISFLRRRLRDSVRSTSSMKLHLNSKIRFDPGGRPCFSRLRFYARCSVPPTQAGAAYLVKGRHFRQLRRRSCYSALLSATDATKNRVDSVVTTDFKISNLDIHY
jgi:hypothetical protein